MTLTDGILIAIAYLWGGIPTAYLIARFISGIDIREYGSGNVGASNAVAHLGAKTGVAIGVFDLVGKGILPVLLAQWLTTDLTARGTGFEELLMQMFVVTPDENLAAPAAVGLAAVVGHNWSPYIRFTGGRGVSTAGGLLLAFALWQEALIAAVIIVGLGRLVFKDVALLTLTAVIALPITAVAFDRPPEIIAMCALIVALLIAKRLTANWERPSIAQPLSRTIACRILWDRDVSRRKDWTDRTPNSSIAEASLNDTDPVLR